MKCSIAIAFFYSSFKEYITTKLEDNQVVLKLKGACQLLVSANVDNLFSEGIISLNMTQKNRICVSL